MPPGSLSRRDFLRTTSLAASALTFGVTAAPAAAVEPRFPLIGFSKPFQNLNALDTARLVAEVGWNGIECPVRPKGHIEPEQAADRLPEFVETLRRQGLDIHVMTTAITSLRDPHSESLLRLASRLGIKRIRLGTWRYDPNRNPAEQLPEVGAALRDLASACRELGLQAGLQNHSGRTYIGGPIWDVFPFIRDLDPRAMGYCFDIGHATVEGGLSWPNEAKLAEPFYTAVFVKDFVWKKGDRGWAVAWCNLGEGMVSRTFFDELKQSAYRGPISQHHEYKWADQSEMVAHMKRDLQVLKSWLA